MVTIFLFFQLVLGDVKEVDAFMSLSDCNIARKEAIEYYEMGKKMVVGFTPPTLTECTPTLVPKPENPGEPA